MLAVKSEMDIPAFLLASHKAVDSCWEKLSRQAGPRCATGISLFKVFPAPRDQIGRVDCRKNGMQRRSAAISNRLRIPHGLESKL